MSKIIHFCFYESRERGKWVTKNVRNEINIVCVWAIYIYSTSQSIYIIYSMWECTYVL